MKDWFRSIVTNYHIEMYANLHCYPIIDVLKLKLASFILVCRKWSRKMTPLLWTTAVMNKQNLKDEMKTNSWASDQIHRWSYKLTQIILSEIIEKYKLAYLHVSYMPLTVQVITA